MLHFTFYKCYNITFLKIHVYNQETIAVIACKNQASHSTTKYMEQQVLETTWAT